MYCKLFGCLFTCQRPKNEFFENSDTDKDGRLSLNEFHEHYVNIYGKPPSNEQWMKFHFADKNNNGYISKFDMELFEKHNPLL